MSALRDALVLPAVLAGELAAARLLHGLAAVPGLAGPTGAPTQWLTWLAVTPPEDALAAVARLLAVGLVWWLTLSTLLVLAAGVVRWRPAQAAAGRVAPQFVRRLVDRALGALLAASVAMGPAPGAHADMGAPVAVAAPGRLPPGASGLPGPSWDLPPVWESDANASPVIATRGDGTGDDTSSVAAGEPVAAGPESPPSEPVLHTVKPGEHLWALAEQTVRAHRPTASTGEVAQYWRRLVAANGDRLRSGDPHLVFPGEQLVVPLPASREGPVGGGR